jgi:hypothetical protein
MRTLADLKRELTVGKSLKLISFSTPFAVNNKNLNKVRFIVRIQGNGLYLNEDKNTTKGSYLEFPKASLLEYDGKTIKIYEPGIRDLTEEEKKIRDNEPKDDEQDRIDMMSDGSQMFYRRKQYYKEKGCEYLFWGDSTRGKSKHITRQGNGELKIVDDSIKGIVSLIYEVI